MPILAYCKLCLYPASKPDLHINSEGICSACTAYKQRSKVDWAAREEEFRNICAELIRQGHQYHCIVPVSGGKDSHYQILTAKQHNLNPLAVNARTDELSTIGRTNLDNITRLGVDLIEVAVNKQVRYKINAFTLREVGDISWAEHVTIFSIPVRIALNFNVPLILWGENPQNEYGGPTNAVQEARQLDQRWLSEFGGLLGLRVSDLIDAKVATKEELSLYSYPDVTSKTCRGLFLGQYFPWSGADNALLASQNGFKTWPCPVEGTGYNYENLDNLQTGIHDFFKFIKYGFGRTTDIVNNHLRRGSISRQEGKEIILANDGAYPLSYLGVSLDRILAPLGIDVVEFVEIVRRFTNKNLFHIEKGRPRPIPLFLEDLRRA